MKKNDIYQITYTLDPRIKYNLLKKNHPDINEIITRIKNFLKEAYLLDQELPSRPITESQKAKMSFELDFLQEYGIIIEAENDIDRYFDGPVIPLALVNGNASLVQQVLDWWAIHKHEFLLIFVIARDFLPIPGAEVDVERLFNIGRESLGLRRMSMSVKTMRALVLLKDYLRREKQGQVQLYKRITCNVALLSEQLQKNKNIIEKAPFSL